MEGQQYKLLDGKAVSAEMKREMAEEVAIVADPLRGGCHRGGVAP